MNRWEIRSSRTIFESRWIRLQQDDIRLPNGEDITYTWVDHGGYVVVLPILDDGRVVMERVYRHTVKRTLLECPSGGLDGEEPIAAGRRELEEETGYTASAMVELAEGPIAVGVSDENVRFFHARGLTRVGPGGGDDTEDITVHEVAPRDLAEFLADGRRRGLGVDAKIFAGLYLVGLSGEARP
jgi:ADP-ribose pyrophosphatase